MLTTRYEPWSLLNQLSRELDRLNPAMGGGEEAAATSDWVPAVDIREEKEAYVLHADVPGVDPKDIEVHMENGVLTIRGERKAESAEEREGYKRVERIRGSFYRRFSLPDTADAERISARSANGVLEVRIPKQEKVQPRRITVEG
ncbi:MULTISPECIES: Hsp20/alpha crystallin family protein [Ectothiorhodospira]|jgi:HSP20 family protein|uniref:HSP20 family protein n=1 Tax=Ectothiorhodospira marina TaxID=1396821 RepID=A0A1H7RDY2_9GAMM|nr:MULTISPECIES: Hsp20/alpha crystallin family protein [Ectothiorhodospira]MCG5515314.1 Hsp20/alpha crystallin family protein [Ectothiorhodospira sp. 9100]MCG5519405.1 Hsp20/alpha crystallin family protein [Ectothiorhodospira sp. 9905]SEL58225.1 HSP20 family protein [Ectothiorhodospira marina]